MELCKEKQMKYVKRLLLSRMRILNKYGFYGLLLMHMSFGLDEEIETAATDGKTIRFCPKFMDELSDTELDFVMLHEIMHVVLQHCFRGIDHEHERYNIACDMVVNSVILVENGMNKQSITLKKYGESMHISPDGNEGCVYTAEEIYEMLPSNNKGKNKKGKGTAKDGEYQWDDHSEWPEYIDDEAKELWISRMEAANKSVMIREREKGRGLGTILVERIIEEYRKPQIDWRYILNDFIQVQVVDYSFTPPDRRMDESPFYLPDLNDISEEVGDILFMVDTSGSMSNREVWDAYSEIKGAMDQFAGKLSGWIGFFDGGIIEPKPFGSVHDLSNIHPVGGGGTDFGIIFRYVQEHMKDKKPLCIIILTDGYAPYPPESAADGIPVLWVINNEISRPPWGKVARIK